MRHLSSLEGEREAEEGDRETRRKTTGRIEGFFGLLESNYPPSYLGSPADMLLLLISQPPPSSIGTVAEKDPSDNIGETVSIPELFLERFSSLPF